VTTSSDERITIVAIIGAWAVALLWSNKTVRDSTSGSVGFWISNRIRITPFRSEAFSTIARTHRALTARSTDTLFCTCPAHATRTCATTHLTHRRRLRTPRTAAFAAPSHLRCTSDLCSCAQRALALHACRTAPPHVASRSVCITLFTAPPAPHTCTIKSVVHLHITATSLRRHPPHRMHHTASATLCAGAHGALCAIRTNYRWFVSGVAAVFNAVGDDGRTAASCWSVGIVTYRIRGQAVAGDGEGWICLSESGVGDGAPGTPAA